jgi:hypothetical protein
VGERPARVRSTHALVALAVAAAVDGCGAVETAVVVGAGLVEVAVGAVVEALADAEVGDLGDIDTEGPDAVGVPDVADAPSPPQAAARTTAEASPTAQARMGRP